MPLQGFTIIKDSAQVACGSCIELMRSIPDGSVDLVLTDPPYNLGLFMKERGTNMEKLRPNHFAFQGWDDLDFPTWSEQMKQFMAECHRVLKKRGALVVFMSVIKIESIINFAKDNGFYYKTTGVWHKKNPIPRNMNLHFLNSIEPWIYFINDGTTGTFNNDGKPFWSVNLPTKMIFFPMLSEYFFESFRCTILGITIVFELYFTQSFLSPSVKATIISTFRNELNNAFFIRNCTIFMDCE